MSQLKYIDTDSLSITPISELTLQAIALGWKSIDADEEAEAEDDKDEDNDNGDDDGWEVITGI